MLFKDSHTTHKCVVTTDKDKSLGGVHEPMSVPEEARRALSGYPGVVAVGWDGVHVIAYVETEGDAARLPREVAGHTVLAKVVGRIRLL